MNNESNPKVSIVVATYNSNHIYLRQALNSVFNQTYKNIELIVVDDASIDKSFYSVINTPKISKIIKLEKNSGTHYAQTVGTEAASGDFVGYLDHDDLLDSRCIETCINYFKKYPYYGMVYTDHLLLDNNNVPVAPTFKEDFNDDLLLHSMYILHFKLMRRAALKEFLPLKYHGAQDYDLALRFSEKYKIGHVRKLLYSWRKAETSTATIEINKSIISNNYQAVKDALQRRNINADIKQDGMPTHWHIDRKLETTDPVNIIIVTKNNVQMLKSCVESIETNTLYPYQLTIVDTGSDDINAINYLNMLKNKHTILYDKYHFSKTNNNAAKVSKCKYICFMNNDVIVKRGWLIEMMKQIQRSDVGIVGAKLIYPQKYTIQHAGVALGYCGLAGHLFEGIDYRHSIVNKIKEMSAVTGACLLIKKDVFDKIGGFDEKYSTEFQDVDLCVACREAGYKVIYTPYAEAFHHCGATRGIATNDEMNHDRPYFANKWKKILFTRFDMNLTANLISNDHIQHIKNWLDLYDANLKRGFYA